MTLRSTAVRLLRSAADRVQELEPAPAASASTSDVEALRAEVAALRAAVATVNMTLALQRVAGGDPVDGEMRMSFVGRGGIAAPADPDATWDGGTRSWRAPR